MGTRVKHKGKCSESATGKCSVKLPFTKSLNRSEQRTQHHFPKMNSAADDKRLTQFSTAAGFGNDVNLKSRLLFSLIYIQYQFAFCFQSS